MTRAGLTIFATQLRRDRWVLAFWIGGIALFGLAVAAAITSQFESAADRAAIVALSVANPAIIFARGLPDGDSLGAVAFFTGFAFTAVLAGLMSTFLVVRHSRADEETGRAELLGATPLGRATPLAATLALGALTNLVVVGVLTLAYAAGGLPLDGSVIAALAVGAVGLVFVSIAAVVAQLMPSGRAANGAATALVIGAYLVRGIGDALGTPSDDLMRVEPAVLSWFSPIGWGQATRPFTEPTLLPLLLSLVAFLVLAAAALLLRARRDLGSSLLPERGGRATARLGGRSVL
ncbi:MAG: polyketide antibiotic transporter, partial [Yonghaparkia sp.]|nr:polyketide antibiotic transporter [Microcella sp.]